MKFDVAIRHFGTPSERMWRVEVRQGNTWNVWAPFTATRNAVQQEVIERYNKLESGIMWIESESGNLFGTFVPLQEVESKDREVNERSGYNG